MKPDCRLFLMLLLLIPQLGWATNSPAQGRQPMAKTFRLMTMSVIHQQPNGRILDIWEQDTTFTSTDSAGEWIKISGYFPAGQWQPNKEQWWVRRDYAYEITPSSPSPVRSRRSNDPPRHIVVDKSDFTLTIFEERDNRLAPIFDTIVAVGMDRCMPKEKGGRCYYTDPGNYQVRWKVHDPKGIEWCIPKYMEKEYPRAIARGQRCFRGVLGNFALNIGKSYAIHGTNNPATLGTKASHGCIRVANNDMKQIYYLMNEGDKVTIKE